MVLCLALADFTGAQPTTAPLSALTVSQIDRAVTAFMTRVNAPGLSLAVGVGGELSARGCLTFRPSCGRSPSRSSCRTRAASATTRRRKTTAHVGWIVGGWGVPGAPRIPGLAWHGGVQQGVTTNLYMLAPEGTVVAVMINLEGEGLALTELATQITDIVLGR